MSKRRASAPKQNPKKPAKTAAELHEAARVARRAGEAPEVVTGLLEQASAAERTEAEAK